MTATPVFYKDRLYVGSASREEALSVSPGYLCCTFRGSESALDAATGKVLWKTYTIAEAGQGAAEDAAWRDSLGSVGRRRLDRAGARPERDTMYVTTGDNYSDPPTAHERRPARFAHVHRRDSVVQAIHGERRVEQFVPASKAK